MEAIAKPNRFWLGILFLLLLYHIIFHLHMEAMIYVVVEELILEMSDGTYSNIRTVFFAEASEDVNSYGIWMNRHERDSC